eukprot:scaffold224224_cov28-Tisochrysis_lutea.AAC.2
MAQSASLTSADSLPCPSVWSKSTAGRDQRSSTSEAASPCAPVQIEPIPFLAVLLVFMARRLGPRHPGLVFQLLLAATI